jgi:hypothetical protein
MCGIAGAIGHIDETVRRALMLIDLQCSYQLVWCAKQRLSPCHRIRPSLADKGP